jgi:Fe-S-cluster containining protein
VQRAEDGTLRIPIKGIACSALRVDRMCGVYEQRPAVCRVYPYQVHAGRRIQVVVSLACPGTIEKAFPHEHHAHALHPAADTEDMTRGARDVAAFVLQAPGAVEMATRAKETFTEFDRRMKEWGVVAPPDRLRAAFLPHVGVLARPESLPTFFAGLGDGALLLEGKAGMAVERLFASEPEDALVDLLTDAARDAFTDADDALWVEPDFRWTQPRWTDGRVELVRHRPGERVAGARFDPEALPTEWSDEAAAVLARYLTRLCHRDHTEGAAAWVVDASGYQVTLPAAFGRVLGEAALQVVLRAGMLAAEAGATEIDAPAARRGIAAYETSFHSLPTLGSIL